MDEKVKSIQARLRGTMSGSLAIGPQFGDVPLVSFEEMVGMRPGTESLILKVTEELKKRGYRVANIKRFSVNTVQEREKNIAAPYTQAGSDAVLLAVPHRAILVHRLPGETSLDDMVSLLGTNYDVIIGESFGFLSVPKFLMTEKPQEGFNLGLPNIIGYISDKDAGAIIPRFSPQNVEAVADKIVADIITPRATQRVSAVVDDSPVFLSEEKKELLRGAIAKVLIAPEDKRALRSLRVTLDHAEETGESDA